jgi:hypothetical protein
MEFKSNIDLKEYLSIQFEAVVYLQGHVVWREPLIDSRTKFKAWAREHLILKCSCGLLGHFPDSDSWSRCWWLGTKFAGPIRTHQLGDAQPRVQSG